MGSSTSIDLTLSSRLLNWATAWCRLEQIIPDESETAPNVGDLYNLWLAAATGRSAQRLRPASCPVELDGDTIRAFLGFYVWPSAPALQYRLSSALGKIGPRMAISKHREFSVWLDDVDRYALPYFMHGVSVIWETPTFNRYGVRAERPAVTVEAGIWLVFSAQVSGAIRVAGLAIGASVVLEMEFKKGLVEEGTNGADNEDWHRGPNGEIILNPTPNNRLVSERISNVKNVISVTWQGGEDSVLQNEVVDTSTSTSQLDVVLPQCLADLLSFCPDPFFGTEDNSSLFCEQLNDKRVYYNACNGQVLGSREGDDGQSYCSRVAAPGSGAVPAWLPEGWSR